MPLFGPDMAVPVKTMRLHFNKIGYQMYGKEQSRRVPAHRAKQGAGYGFRRARWRNAMTDEEDRSHCETALRSIGCSGPFIDRVKTVVQQFHDDWEKVRRPSRPAGPGRPRRPVAGSDDASSASGNDEASQDDMLGKRKEPSSCERGLDDTQTTYHAHPRKLWRKDLEAEEEVSAVLRQLRMERARCLHREQELEDTRKELSVSRKELSEKLSAYTALQRKVIKLSKQMKTLKRMVKSQEGKVTPLSLQGPASTAASPCRDAGCLPALAALPSQEVPLAGWSAAGAFAMGVPHGHPAPQTSEARGLTLPPLHFNSSMPILTRML